MKSGFDGSMLVLLVIFILVLGASVLIGVQKEWVFAFLTAILSVLGWIYSSAKNSQREIEARLFSEKAALYKKIFNLFPELVKKIKRAENSSQKKKDVANDRNLIEKMIDIKSELLIWGSEETIISWTKIENSDFKEGGDPREIILVWDRLYSCMRADLGHSDYKIKDGDLVQLFITTEDRKDLSK
ncbi:MAG: hypothetical protein HQ512_09070 [Rhodospirillales bacterium]|nr:hypothetical protein [Rhodospirillales bacterium]